jgi:glucose-6-phosphate-specific signal transduction histidine kinase
MSQTFEGGISVYEKAIIFNSLIYSVWCFYFSRQILKERFTPVKTAVIILLTHVVIILGGRRLFPNGIPFILVHTASILSIFLWHYGSVKRKLLTYCLYTGMAMLLEMLIMSLFSFAQRLLYHRLSSMIGEISVQTSTDLIILSIIFLIVGSPMCKIIADFTGAVSRFSSILPIVQIIFPYYWFCIVLSMIYAFNVPFGSYLFLFAAITVPVVPIFISGIRNLYLQEKNRILREKQVSLKKEQLELMNSLELEYQDLRKWNHDIENHLLSMNYLMKTEKYNEARQYLDSISK